MINLFEMYGLVEKGKSKKEMFEKYNMYPETYDKIKEFLDKKVIEKWNTT